MELADLTPAERRIWQAFPLGEPVDFRQASGEVPQRGDSWGPERTVRAKVLRTLLLSSAAEEGEIAALRLTGARISGSLNLQYGNVENAVRLWGCHFDHAPILYGAQFRQLNLSESYLPALVAATVRVDGVLRFTDCRIPGRIQLGGAKISGALFLDRAHLGVEEGDHDGESVLELNHATIDDDVWAPGLVAYGQVRLAGATIAGVVNLDDAELNNAGGTALDAKNITVGSDLRAMRLRCHGLFSLEGGQISGRLDLENAELANAPHHALNATSLTIGTDLNAARLTAHGLVKLTAAKITGQLDLRGSRLSNPGHVALGASRCEAEELAFWDAERISGEVYLRYARFNVIHADPNIWPGSVRLTGLTYETLEPRMPATERLELLKREVNGFVPHAYEQLAATYQRVGDDADARTVLLAKQRRNRAALPWYAKAWGYLQDATVGYGYRPMRAAAWLLALLALSAIAFGLHHPLRMETGKGPTFNPVIYSLDLLLPIIDFGQEKAFNPRGWYQWLSYLLIAAGWILATTIAAGITRALSRQ